MNWTYIVGGAAVTLTLLGLLHQLLVNRKNATIETLAEKNKWLQEQLDQAKNASSDALVELRIPVIVSSDSGANVSTHSG
jgi:hypothetical protein